jgi:ribosomal-protein-alanine N-acetyltransferase
MVRIEPMTPAHLPAVVAIEAVSFPLPWTGEMFAAEMKHAFSRCSVAVDDAGQGGEAVVRGYIVYWLTADEVQLHDVAVAPAHRGRGIARQLMESMLAEGRRHQAARAFLEVRVGNASAIALYERLGFARIGKRRAYYRDNDEDALVMALDLQPAGAPP